MDYLVTYTGHGARIFMGETWQPGEERRFDAAYLGARGRTGTAKEEAELFQAVFTNNGATPYIDIRPAEPVTKDGDTTGEQAPAGDGSGATDPSTPSAPADAAQKES